MGDRDPLGREEHDVPALTGRGVDVPAGSALPRDRARPWSPWLALALVLLVSLLPRLAAASSASPVIVPGREPEVLALVRPYALGDPLAPGWVLHSIEIDADTITISLVGPDERSGQLTLHHHDYGPPGARKLHGFALAVVARPPGSEAAMEALIAAIERNDDGSFWGEAVVYADQSRQHPHRLGGPGRGLLHTLGTWARDGIVALAALTLLLVAWAAAELRGTPRWMRWALPGIVVLGAVLRVAMSPAVALAPWPYTRVLTLARMIFEGPGLAALHPEPVWLTETILDSTLLLSILAPLAVYVHARYLLGDPRASLGAALVIAILPLHLRFSHSDTAFIPSITISSTVFALIHAATRAPSRLVGWLALSVVGLPLVLLYEVRPLNLMVYPLLLATALVDGGLHTQKPPTDRLRVVALFVVVSAVTFGLGVPRLFEQFGIQVDEGLRLTTLTSALRVLVDPRLNELVNPVFSPPGLTALAVLGAVDLWRRGRRPLFWFLLSWLLGLLIAHAYVVPPSMYMQARYHLHLVVPYTLLSVCGADAGLRWLAARRQHAAWLRGPRYALVRLAALSYVLASPLVHLHGVRYVALNDVHEWRFVHGLRQQIPERCTILEFTGKSPDMRFARVGHAVAHGIPQQRWKVVEIRSPKDGEPTIPPEVRALLDDPPRCLYWYEGLPCFGHKSPEQPEAPACLAVETLVQLEPIAETRFDSERYDENLAAGLGDLEHIELHLYRVRTEAPGRPSSPEDRAAVR